MLLIGDHTTLVDQNGEPYVKDLMVFNMSSPLEGFERIDILPGNVILTEENQKEFDIIYANYIINFKIFEMMKVMLPIYDGMNVMLLVYRDNGYFDAITESVCKFIQSRYGIVPVNIITPDDYDSIHMSQYVSSFSVNGLFNLDHDKELYSREIARRAIENGLDNLPEGQLY